MTKAPLAQSTEPQAPKAPVRVAITGSSGFVGRHLVAHLLRHGYTVRGVSRAQVSPAGCEHQHVEDYRAPHPLQAAFADCDVVVHLAARAHVLRDTAENPTLAFREANLDSATAVAAAAAKVGVRRVVMLSSVGVNGDQSGAQPFHEADAPAPVEPYAISKWEAEQAVARLLAGCVMDYVILRPTLVYGPDCPGNFRLLLRLVQKLPVVPLGGLRRPRSLIHVENLCDAIRTALDHPGASRRTFLLSDGVDLSVSEVAVHLARGFGKSAATIWPIPEGLLRALAALVGRQAAVDKLANSLQVDAMDFTAATGWKAPLAPPQALEATARGFAKGEPSPRPESPNGNKLSAGAKKEL